MLDSKELADFRDQINRLRRRVKRFPNIAQRELDLGLRKAMMFLVGEAAQYPAELPGSTYRRTGLLGRLWLGGRPRVSVGGRVLEVRWGNASPYGPKVQGDEQVEVHRGRWKTVDQIVADSEATVMAFVEAAGGRIVTQIAQGID